MEEFTEQELKEIQADAMRESREAKYGQYSDVIKKMKSFLCIAGEKTSKDTKELFREHIPVSVFGVSSDEIATDLGMSENELMSEITAGLNIGGRSTAYKPYRERITRVVLSIVEKRIAREKKRIAWLREHFGCIYYGELAKLAYSKEVNNDKI